MEKFMITLSYLELPWWLSGKGSTCQCRRCWFDPCIGRSGEENGNPPQNSCLGNPMDRRAWGLLYMGLQNSQICKQLKL